MARRISPLRRLLSLFLALGILLAATHGYAQQGHCRKEQRCCPGQSACSAGPGQGASRSDETPPDEGSEGESSRGHCEGVHCHACLGIPSALVASTPLPSEEFVPLPASFSERLVPPEIFRPPLT